MRKAFLAIATAALFIFSGCASNYYNIPQENFTEKVKVLGVAPIFVDPDSEIIYPQKEALLALLSEKNRNYESALARKLRATGNFYTVAPLGGDADTLFKNMLFRREFRDDASIKYNKYFWKSDELKNYISTNNVDAVMLLVVSGLTKEERIFSSNLLNSLNTRYNYLILTAQIVDANGTVLWEYPNFRQKVLSYSPMLNMQYPDFSESEANKSPTTNVKFKSIDGIRRALDEKKKDLLLRDTQEITVYGKQFDEITALLGENKEKGKSAPDQPAAQPAERSTQPPPPAKPAAVVESKAPPVEAPKQQIPAETVTAPKPPAQPSTPTAPAAVDIAPATGSTK